MRARFVVISTGGAAILAAALGGAIHAQTASKPNKLMKPIAPAVTIQTAANPGSIVATVDALWVATAEGVQRINPQTNAVVATIPTGGWMNLAVGAGSVWASDFDESTVRRIDPARNRVVAKIDVGANPAYVTFANGALWVANHRGGSVSRIDPVTNKVVATVKAGNAGPSGPQPIAGGFGDVWTGVSNINAVVRIDTATNHPKAQVNLPSSALACGTIVAAKTALWVSSCAEMPTVTQINPRTNKAVGTVNVGGWANDGVVVDGKAWYVVSRIDAGKTARLVRLAPGQTKPTAVRELASTVKDPNGMRVAFGSLWLADDRSGKVLRFPVSVLK